MYVSYTPMKVHRTLTCSLACRTWTFLTRLVLTFATMRFVVPGNGNLHSTNRQPAKVWVTRKELILDRGSMQQPLWSAW